MTEHPTRREKAHLGAAQHPGPICPVSCPISVQYPEGRNLLKSLARSNVSNMSSHFFRTKSENVKTTNFRQKPTFLFSNNKNILDILDILDRVNKINNLQVWLYWTDIGRILDMTLFTVYKSTVYRFTNSRCGGCWASLPFRVLSQEGARRCQGMQLKEFGTRNTAKKTKDPQCLQCVVVIEGLRR